MALRRTDTIQMHDVVVLIHMNELQDTSPDRNVPCPFDGFVERVIWVTSGEVGTGVGGAYDCNLIHRRNGTALSTTAIDIPDATAADTPYEFSYNALTSPAQFACGDVLEFDPSGDGSTSTESVTATVVLRRT